MNINTDTIKNKANELRQSFKMWTYDARFRFTFFVSIPLALLVYTVFIGSESAVIDIAYALLSILLGVFKVTFVIVSALMIMQTVKSKHLVTLLNLLSSGKYYKRARLLSKAILALSSLLALYYAYFAFTYAVGNTTGNAFTHAVIIALLSTAVMSIVAYYGTQDILEDMSIDIETICPDSIMHPDELMRKIQKDGTLLTHRLVETTENEVLIDLNEMREIYPRERGAQANE